jgi:hypothetical protein
MTTIGLGWPHRQERARQLAALRDGVDPCPRCGRPMYRTQRLDLDDFPSRVIAARFGITPIKRLSHASENRSAGATLGNRMRGARKGRTRRIAPPPSRRRVW